MNNKFEEDNGDGPKKFFDRAGGRISVLTWTILGLILVFFLIWIFTANNSTSQTDKLSYSAFLAQVQAGNVSKITVTGNNKVEGSLVKPLTVNSAGNANSSASQFVTYLPPIADTGLFPLLREKNVEVNISPTDSTSWIRIMINILPFAALLVIGYLLFRRTNIGSEDLTSMVKSRARRYTGLTDRITFDDVAGSQGVKQELDEVIQFLKNPHRFQQLGAKIPKGVLLVGQPGTGKTLLARAVAGEANVPFFSISGSDFMEMFVGVGASRVRDLFQQAKENAPSIIFIDELDSIGRKRGIGIGGGHDEREQTLNQMLSEMDGFEPNQNVIVMASTNRPDILDPALLRPGRFDRQVVVDLPTLNDRVEILKVHARNKPLADDVDMVDIARGTVGFSGADLANLLNEAALMAARHQKQVISKEDIVEAYDKVLLGLERNLALTEDEYRLLAYHEAGHAVVAAILPNTDPVMKVTIIPRGRAMGVTQQLPERDRFLYPMDYMLDRLAVMMGGRAAEDLSMKTMTSGAADDLKQATRLARRMVIEWGMSETVGHISLSDEYQESYLGDDIMQSRMYSEATAQEVDQEVRAILETAYDRARQTLQENREALDRVVEALLQKEQLLGDELLNLLGKKSTKTSLPIERRSKQDPNLLPPRLSPT
jgi:cell division protease FtsH